VGDPPAAVAGHRRKVVIEGIEAVEWDRGSDVGEKGRAAEAASEFASRVAV
jgi:hypothetical protein